MSALGQKRPFDPGRLNGCFTPQSGHSFEGGPMAAFDPKRTFSEDGNVRVNASGHYVDGRVQAHWA